MQPALTAHLLAQQGRAKLASSSVQVPHQSVHKCLPLPPRSHLPGRWLTENQ